MIACATNDLKLFDKVRTYHNPFQLDSSTTLLHIAASEGALEVLERLLDFTLAGDEDDLDSSDNTLLHTACIFGQYNVAKKLLRDGYSSTDMNIDNLSPFMLACESKNLDLIELFFEEVSLDENFVEFEHHFPTLEWYLYTRDGHPDVSYIDHDLLSESGQDLVSRFLIDPQETTRQLGVTLGISGLLPLLFFFVFLLLFFFFCHWS
jgi:ankyrin repeat protein